MSRHVKVTADDPFGLKGKNPRRVAPAVRRNITMQKARIRAAWVFTILCVAVLALPFFGINSLLWTWVVALVLAPVYFLGVYCERRLLHFEQSRLAECERLIQEGNTPQ